MEKEESGVDCIKKEIGNIVWALEKDDDGLLEFLLLHEQKMLLDLSAHDVEQHAMQALDKIIEYIIQRPKEFFWDKDCFEADMGRELGILERLNLFSMKKEKRDKLLNAVLCKSLQRKLRVLKGMPAMAQKCSSLLELEKRLKKQVESGCNKKKILKACVQLQQIADGHEDFASNTLQSSEGKSFCECFE